MARIYFWNLIKFVKEVLKRIAILCFGAYSKGPDFFTMGQWPSIVKMNKIHPTIQVLVRHTSVVGNCRVLNLDVVMVPALCVLLCVWGDHFTPLCSGTIMTSRLRMRQFPTTFLLHLMMDNSSQNMLGIVLGDKKVLWNFRFYKL
jgi:hypothetical protein